MTRSLAEGGRLQCMYPLLGWNLEEKSTSCLFAIYEEFVSMLLPSVVLGPFHSRCIILNIIRHAHVHYSSVPTHFIQRASMTHFLKTTQSHVRMPDCLGYISLFVLNAVSGAYNRRQKTHFLLWRPFFDIDGKKPWQGIGMPGAMDLFCKIWIISLAPR